MPRRQTSKTEGGGGSLRAVATLIDRAESQIRRCLYFSTGLLLIAALFSLIELPCYNKVLLSLVLLKLTKLMRTTVNFFLFFLFHFILHSNPLSNFFSFLLCYVVNLTASCTLPSFRETYDCILVI